MPPSPGLMRRPAVTIKQVARAAGVSVATVSRVVNGKGPVREDTRRRIQRLVEKLRYVPHGAARSLITRKTHTLGVLLPDLFGEFFSELIRGIDAAARARGYHLLVSGYHEDPAETREVLRAIRGRVDGLIALSPQLDRRAFEENLPEGFPVVFLNAAVRRRGSASIRVDNSGGAFAMARHLIGLGHRRIAFVTGPAGNHDASERLRGFRKALRIRPEATALLVAGDFREEAGYRAAHRILGAKESATAAFAANDAMAIGMLAAFREHRVRIPEDIALAGFDDVPIARFVSPPLTTVRVPIADLGSRGTARLLRALEGGPAIRPGEEVLPTTLVVRASCGAPASPEKPRDSGDSEGSARTRNSAEGGRTMKGRSGFGGLQRLAGLVLLGALLAAGAAAQTTTGTLRGTVRDQSGGVLPGVTVEAVNADSGGRLAATTRADGFFNLSVVPGPYTVTATLSGFATATRKTRVLVGQTQGLDFELALSAQTAAVTVSAEAPVIETRSAEVATNVTERQLKQLPQDNRNFLAFAQLAPGVRYNDSPLSKTITSGAVDANAVNVFIDGTSYKNDVLTGGVSGQDTSRGNPFPQNAVQEFRVVTQNFKAEYEKSSSAIITAVTKSGGNDFHGDGFAQYQDKSLVADDPCADTVNGRCGTAHKPSHEKPDYTRWQAGVSIGGPIVKDRVHFFGSWEYNDQDRANNVAVGSQIGLVPQPLRDDLLSREGNITSPFQSNLAFGKISWQASESDMVDTSGFYRKENEIRDFGGQTSFESANNIENGVWNAQVKNTWVNPTYLSETTVSYNDYRWNPQPVNPGQIGQNYEQVLRIGGGNNHQDFDQRRFTAREDFSYLGLQWVGNHVIKAGAYVNSNSYNVHKFQNDNPEFDYTSSISPDFSFPYQAFFGFGNPDISAHNNQYGVYVQDDWTVNPRLTVNVGLRWDYETDQLNNSYVTPANVVSELSGKVPDGYFTDGTQRPDYTNEFQPRVGFSWDLSGKGSTVVFGGYGRYFDRDTYNYVLDERYRLQYTRLQFLFSADGLPRNGVPTIKWDPKYLSAAGLAALAASGIGPKPQVFLIDNDTKPPVSDQFTAGIRQQFGEVGVSMSYVGSRSRNGYTYIWNNFPCCQHPAPDFAEVLLSQASKRGWYDALLVSANKAYTTSSPWGATLAYTWGHATGTGGDLFSLDYVNVAAYPRHRTQFDERHRIVLSGIVGLPWDTRFSTIVTLGTGRGFTIVNGDFFGPGLSQVLLYSGTQSGTFPEQSIDLQLQKDFAIGPGRIGFTISVFNVTNHDNLDPGSIDGFIPKNGTNPNFGTAGSLLTLPRRLQFGLQVGF